MRQVPHLGTAPDCVQLLGWQPLGSLHARRTLGGRPRLAPPAHFSQLAPTWRTPNPVIARTAVRSKQGRESDQPALLLTIPRTRAGEPVATATELAHSGYPVVAFAIVRLAPAREGKRSSVLPAPAGRFAGAVASAITEERMLPMALVPPRPRCRGSTQAVGDVDIVLLGMYIQSGSDPLTRSMGNSILPTWPCSLSASIPRHRPTGRPSRSPLRAFPPRSA